MLTLANTVHAEIGATKRLLEEIKLRQSPSIHYDELLIFFNQMNDYTNSMVESIETFMSNETRIEKRQEIIMRTMILHASYITRQINSYCNSFEYADQLTVSSASMQLLHRLLGYVSTHKAFIVRGTTKYNYTYDPIGDSLNRLASALNKLASTSTETIKTLDQSFAVVSFPLAINKNVLLNCNLVHEMGHLIVDSENLQDKLWETLDSKKKEDVGKIIEKHAMLGRQIDFETAKRTKEINRVLSNWIHEAMADCLGLCLLGPAFMFAFIEFIEPLGVFYRDDDEHPCSATRINMMFELLQKLKWDKFVESECPGLWKRAKDIGAVKREPSLMEHDAANECLPIILPDIQGVVKILCGANIYQPELLLASKAQIWDLLARGVPPAENTRDTLEFVAFDSISIINAAWAFSEKNYPSWETRFGQMNLVEKGELLNRLITKALEISFFLEAKAKANVEGK